MAGTLFTVAKSYLLVKICMNGSRSGGFLDLCLVVKFGRGVSVDSGDRETARYLFFFRSS